MKKLLALFLAAVLLLLTVTGCTKALAATDLMEDMTADATIAENAVLTDTANHAIASFSTQLLTTCADGSENVLVSPLSVLLALGMTANGASGETLAQMEAMFGLPADELNEALAAWTAGMPSYETCSVELANSIWLRDDESLHVEDQFLQTNADYYGAQAYAAPFDKTTVSDINKWIFEHTNEMIDGVIQQIGEDTMLYLINAVALDAEWSSPYQQYQIETKTFTQENGTTQDAEMMRSSVYSYLHDENTTGFLKHYNSNGNYAFCALLPAEGIAMADYLAQLDGEKWLGLMNSHSSERVITELPKFSTGSNLKLTEALRAMGMTDAFHADTADLSAMGYYTEAGVDWPLYISGVQHVTEIQVDENGTKAGAVTVVSGAGGSAGPIDPPKRVILDRPFVYAIIDCNTNLPIFLGILMSTE